MPSIEYMLNFLDEEEFLMKIIYDLTKEDIKNDIELEIVSCYGGARIGRCNVSDIRTIIKEQEEKIVNRDYTFIKL